MDEKIRVFLGAITYAEVVYHQTQSNVAGVRALCEPMLCKVIDEGYLGEFAGLGKAVHTFTDLEVDVSMCAVGLEVIAFRDFGGIMRTGICKRSYRDGHPLPIRGDDRVYEKFDDIEIRATTVSVFSKIVLGLNDTLQEGTDPD
jgi:hypothetical protein